MKTRFALSILLALALLALTNLRAQTTEPTAATSDGPIFKNVSDLKWDKIIPDLGENSPEICFLRVDPKRMLPACSFAPRKRSMYENIGTPLTSHTP
jgi:hypothetical protein